MGREGLPAHSDIARCRLAARRRSQDAARAWDVQAGPEGAASARGHQPALDFGGVTEK
jgi:hypothetical protein